MVGMWTVWLGIVLGMVPGMKVTLGIVLVLGKLLAMTPNPNHSWRESPFATQSTNTCRRRSRCVLGLSQIPTLFVHTRLTLFFHRCSPRTPRRNRSKPDARA